MFDVAIIGAGVVGALTARELTRYNLSVCLLEKENDVAMGASKANSGIIHGGFDPEPGTLKAKLNAKGVPLLYKAARELNVPCKNNGSMVLAFGKEEDAVIDELYARGIKNGIKGMDILSGTEARRLESNLSDKVTKALLVTNSGIICPYALTIAAAGNAMDNGAELRTNYEVTAIVRAEDGFRVCSADGRQITARYLVNCAGGFADKIAEIAGDKFFEIIPRAGTAQKLMNCEGYSVGKKVVILGSGDIGLIMARRMSLEGAKVKAVCELMPYSGGLKRNIVQCLEDFGIPLYLSTTVAEIHGRERVEGVTIAKVDENRNIIEETKRYIPCDTLLLSVGLIPENELTRNAGIAIDRITSGATVDENRQTETEGIFACGNVLQVHDLVDYVSDEAEIAGRGAAEYVLNGANCGKTISTKAGNGVRYVLPQRINADEKNDVALFLRVSKPFGKVKYTVSSGDNVLATAVRLKAAPGEMEKIVLKPEKLALVGEEITVSLEEVK